MIVAITNTAQVAIVADHYPRENQIANALISFPGPLSIGSGEGVNEAKK
jgi:hypothetical protein